MEDALIRGSAAPATLKQFSETWFLDFVKWIDRTEITAKTYLKNLRQFAAWMRYKAIINPCREDVIAWRDWLSCEHDAIQLDALSPSGWSYREDGRGKPIRITCRAGTVKQYLQSVKAFFSWASSAGYYPNITTNIHPPRIEDSEALKRNALTADSVRKIEQSITYENLNRWRAAENARKDRVGKIQRAEEQGLRLSAMFLLAVTAGLRCIEISRLNVRDFETMEGRSYIYIWGKGHSEADHRKAIAPEVATAISEYLLIRGKPKGSEPLFAATGNRSQGQRLAPTTISTLFKEAFRAAGYDSERITAHSLRHTAGTITQQLTGDLYTTQRYMRHSKPETTERYLHINTEKEEARIASELISLFRGEAPSSSRDRLDRLLEHMKPDAIDKLTAIAEEMSKP